MSAIGAIIGSMGTALLAAAPGRMVTRAFKDFADRQKSELTAGLYTLISRGQDDTTDYAEYLKVLLVGQIQLAEDATPDQIEEAELAMVDEVRRFARGCQGAAVRVSGWQQSMQLEAPYGWVSFELRVGPLDLVPDLDVSTLASFITFHADTDIPPLESAAEHAKWLAGDQTTSKPDAEDTVTLPQ